MQTDYKENVLYHIHSKYPSLHIVTNDRTIVPVRKTSGYLGIDIYIPSIKLGIDINNERERDHYQYRLDKMRNTEISEEMYKEKYCGEKGIKLINIWSSASDSANFSTIDRVIGSLAPSNVIHNTKSKEKKKGKNVIFDKRVDAITGCVLGGVTLLALSFIVICLASNGILPEDNPIVIASTWILGIVFIVYILGAAIAWLSEWCWILPVLAALFLIIEFLADWRTGRVFEISGIGISAITVGAIGLAVTIGKYLYDR